MQYQFNTYLLNWNSLLLSSFIENAFIGYKYLINIKHHLSSRSVYVHILNSLTVWKQIEVVEWRSFELDKWNSCCDARSLPQTSTSRWSHDVYHLSLPRFVYGHPHQSLRCRRWTKLSEKSYKNYLISVLHFFMVIIR